MTVSEFSDQFDVLYNNITSNQAPGLNEYEKSVFLTKAQEELVKNYLSPKGNPHQEGFDDSAKRQADFSLLMKSATLSSETGTKFDQRSILYSYPNDVFITLSEQLYVDSNPYVVVPISFGDYDRQMAKPYKYPPKYQAWRLITGTKDTGGGVTVGYWHKSGQSNVIAPYTDAGAATLPNSGTTYTSIAAAKADGWSYTSTTIGGGKVPIVEIIGVFASTPTYYIRYVKRPNPIILVDLSSIQNSLTIHGESAAMTSELPEEIHEEILQRAVELAKNAWQGDVNTSVQLGQRSE